MTDLAFPGGLAVTLILRCSVGSGSSTEHPVEIGPALPGRLAWRVDTGHALEAERIVVALGGEPTSCLAVSDSGLPAIQRHYDSLRRDPLVTIRPVKGDRWALTDPVAGCECQRIAWLHPEQAVAHSRGLAHCCAVFGAQRGRTEMLLRQLTAATGAAAWSERWPMDVPSRAVERYGDLFELWKAGVHPDRVHEIHERLGLREPMSVAAYFHITSRAVDLEWLARFAPGGAMAVAWAANTYTPRDADHPNERFTWFQAGLNYRLINQLLGSSYSVEDVQRLASAIGGSVNQAGRVLAEWLAAGCSPSVGDLIRVCRLVPQGRQSPANDAISAVLRQLGPEPAQCTRTEVGLVLVAVGTPTGAVAAMKRGVRSLDDFEKQLHRRNTDGRPNT